MWQWNSSEDHVQTSINKLLLLLLLLLMVHKTRCNPTDKLLYVEVQESWTTASKLDHGKIP